MEQFVVTGMSCAACQARVEKAVIRCCSERGRNCCEEECKQPACGRRRCAERPGDAEAEEAAEVFRDLPGAADVYHDGA